MLNTNKKFFITIFSLLVVIYACKYFFLEDLSGGRVLNKKVRILTYSSFLNEWGPGAKIGAAFSEKYNVEVEWIQASNAGLLIRKMKSMMENGEVLDAVVGIDLLSLEKALQAVEWIKVPLDKSLIDPQISQHIPDSGFIPYDWSPMTFLIKDAGVPKPHSVDDLVKSSYVNSLVLQSPVTSASGLYFLMWIYSLKGEAGTLEYLKKLKGSVRVVASSWSNAYSLFQNNQVPVIFTFFTSIFYHYLNEKDFSYQPVYFNEPHILSIEFAGVLGKCHECDLGKKFVEFLIDKESQEEIMEKNYMLPVKKNTVTGTDFELPKPIRLLGSEEYKNILQKKKEILRFWKEVNL